MSKRAPMTMRPTAETAAAPMTTGAFCVYLHVLPGESAPFFVGAGALAHGAPFRFGASRGLKWHRRVVAAGVSPDQVIVEIESLHAEEASARERCAELQGEIGTNAGPLPRPRVLEADEAALLMAAMKQS